jgi:N-acetylglucosamine malate deacetylase 1
MELISKNKILILAPHTDDAEFGIIQQGKEVYCAAFSACKQSLRPELPADILITEMRNAATVLGLKQENLFLYEYDVRTFNEHRQPILENLIELRNRINPDMIFMPSLNDVHQDHKVIAEEGLRAFKQSTVLCYELPWNNITFTNTCYSILNETFITAKVEAIAEYRSQKHRPYASAEFIRALAVTRGVQIGSSLAECFEIIRLTF